MYEDFNVIGIDRQDLIERGYLDAEQLSDEQMISIADKMHNYLLEHGGYWDAMTDALEELNLISK